MCINCGSPHPCSCIQQVLTPCDPCSRRGGTLTWDFEDVIYHKSNNQISLLTGLGLGNGATLQLVAETIDTYIQKLHAEDWTLTYLRATYVINNTEQFGVAVDQALSALQDEIDDINTALAGIGYLGAVSSDPVTIQNGQYWFRTDLAAANGLRIKLNGSIRTIPTT